MGTSAIQRIGLIEESSTYFAGTIKRPLGYGVAELRPPTRVID